MFQMAKRYPSEEGRRGQLSIQARIGNRYLEMAFNTMRMDEIHWAKVGREEKRAVRSFMLEISFIFTSSFFFSCIVSAYLL